MFVAFVRDGWGKVHMDRWCGTACSQYERARRLGCKPCMMGPAGSLSREHAPAQVTGCAWKGASLAGCCAQGSSLLQQICVLLLMLMNEGREAEAMALHLCIPGCLVQELRLYNNLISGTLPANWKLPGGLKASGAADRAVALGWGESQQHGAGGAL